MILKVLISIITANQLIIQISHNTWPFSKGPFFLFYCFSNTTQFTASLDIFFCLFVFVSLRRRKSF